ncbi:sugar transferase [Vreelandella nanhaiensis]|uniref:Sugar transferase n=1 Tax=Vreelandella nanhaiensis TaxID=1258546 RepID=A0A433KNW3_9GAMM|nr:sugar transferase [Halomonas nanhaiensis]RUR31318.1 sugar transferase [Halomonas nanhaiensis]
MKNGIKRLFDMVTSGVGLIVLSPLLLLVAVWIKLDSKGPVFFMQQRAGREEQPFQIFKFRTMRHRAPSTIDQHQEQVVSAGHDPRITRAGRFIRATSLDELPQLINIFKGDMSVVGPRPVLMEQTEVIPPGYKKRFSVRPGLTGLAQVRGRRSLGWLQQLAYDAEYVDKQSLVFDFKILLLTVKVVLTGSGIYGEAGLNWRTYRDRLNGQSPRDSDVEEAMR